MVIDTGSSVTLIRMGIMCHEGGFSDGPAECSVRTLAGARLPILGRPLLKLNIGGFSATFEGYPVDIEEDCILGADFLEEHRCIIDLARGTLSVDGYEEKIRIKRRHPFENWKIAPDVNPKETTNHTGSDSYIKTVPEHLKDLYRRSTEALKEYEQEDIRRLLYEYKDIFAKGPAQVGRCKTVLHRIDTSRNTPIKQAPRRLPLHRREEVNNLLKDMQKQG